MGVSKTSDHIQIKIKIPNLCQEPPASSKAPNEDLKDMDVLCTFKIKIESQNLDHGYIKDQWPYQNQDQDAKPQSGTSSVLQSPKWGLQGHGCSSHLQNQDRAKIRIMGVSKTSDYIQIKIKMPNLSQEPPASSKAQNEALKDIDDLCTFKFKIENQNLDCGCIKDQWPYPNQFQDAKPKSGTSSILQRPKSGLKRHGCSWHFQNPEKEPKFRTLVYQRPVTIWKSRLRFQTPVRNFQCPQKDKYGLIGKCQNLCRTVKILNTYES